MDIERKWLIKSSGRLLGPFTLSEVVSHVKQQTVSVIDEIRSPEERWLFIREQPQIMIYLKDLNDTSSGFKEGQETTAIEKTKTKTKTLVTGDMAPDENQEQTHVVENSSFTNSLKQIQAQETVLKSSSLEIDSIPTYGYTGDKNFHKKQKKSNRLYKSILIISSFLFLASFLVYFYLQENQKKQVLLQKQKKMELARESVSSGLWEEAFEVFDTLYSSDPQLFLFIDKINYGLMLLKKDPGTQRPEAILNNSSPPEKLGEWKYWALLKIQIALNKGNWDEARSFGNELLAQFPQDIESQFLMVQIEYLAGQFESAFNLLVGFLNQEKETTPLFTQGALLGGLISVALKKEDNSLIQFKALDWLKLNLQQYSPYQFQKQLLLAYLSWNQDPAFSRMIVQNMWNTNVFDSSLYVSPLSRVDFLYSVESLNSLCMDLARWIDSIPKEEMNPDYVSEEAQALASYCTFFGDDTSKGLKIMGISRKKNPRSQLLAGMEANFLIAEDRFAEGRARIQFCGNSIICQVAQIMDCLSREEESCLLNPGNDWSYQKLGPLYFYIQAKVARNRGNDFLFRDHVLKGLQIFPDYQPLIKLKPLK